MASQQVALDVQRSIFSRLDCSITGTGTVLYVQGKTAVRLSMKFPAINESLGASISLQSTATETKDTSVSLKSKKCVLRTLRDTFNITMGSVMSGQKSYEPKTEKLQQLLTCFALTVCIAWNLHSLSRRYVCQRDCNKNSRLSCCVCRLVFHSVKLASESMMSFAISFT